MINAAEFGPWAVVTGASTGIGEQFARLLADAGFKLLLTARDQQRLDTLARELAVGREIEVRTAALDLALAADLDRLLDMATALAPGLVISNAGFGLKGPHHELVRGELRNMLSVNCAAPALLAQALLPGMRQRARAGLIITGSVEGFAPFPLSAAYAASKAFVLSLGEALAWECRDSGVQVEVLAPSATDTPALVKQGFDARRMSGVMTPRDVAAQALQALGEHSVFVPGGTGNRFFARLLALLPRRWATAMAGNAMRKAIEANRRG